MMKAVVYERYGPPEVLQLEEVEKPTPPGDHDVLVEVHAASLNAADLDYLRGTPLVRLGGRQRPQTKILGSDIAGRVEAVGRNVRRFQPGDEVFGDLFAHGFGALAEYVSAPEDVLRPKPASMTFEQAATLPQAALLALQGLRNKRQVGPGDKVLINGAGGGVGTFAVQIARHYGAEVTAVDSARKLEMLRSLGADHVIDYAQEDFAVTGQRYDLILDVVARRSIFDCRRALSPRGIYLLVGGSGAAIRQAAFLGPLISMTGGRKMGILMWKPNEQADLETLIALFEAGKVVPVIDRTYPLSDTAEAFRYLERGHARGKVVIVRDNVSAQTAVTSRS
jgi:NADPH:quinone reductase-like Zn-dependent oxidoreductase